MRHACSRGDPAPHGAAGEGRWQTPSLENAGPGRTIATAGTATPGIREESMPIYEFECAGCGHRFDRLQKLSDPDPADCPECGRPQLRRRVTAPAFRLAGSGWYETDFKKDGDRKRNLAGGDEAPKPAASSESSAPASDAKPAAKTETQPAGKASKPAPPADSS
jgi:putative FmdB family regulatory protein